MVVKVVVKVSYKKGKCVMKVFLKKNFVDMILIQVKMTSLLNGG